MTMWDQKEVQHLQRFQRMGYAFIAMALVFCLGAYLFPTVPLAGSYDWLYLSDEEKESFYMISGIFIVASVYCLRKKRV